MVLLQEMLRADDLGALFCLHHNRNRAGADSVFAPFRTFFSIHILQKLSFAISLQGIEDISVSINAVDPEIHFIQRHQRRRDICPGNLHGVGIIDTPAFDLRQGQLLQFQVSQRVQSRLSASVPGS